MTIPNSPMTRVLTDKERRAVKAELLRLHDMLFNDNMYHRRGDEPPRRDPARKYTVNNLWLDRPDLYARTKLQRGHVDFLTLPKAKRQAQKEL